MVLLPSGKRVKNDAAGGRGEEFPRDRLSAGAPPSGIGCLFRMQFCGQPKGRVPNVAEGLAAGGSIGSAFHNGDASSIRSSVIQVSKPNLFRIGIVASVLLGFLLLAEGSVRIGLSERRLRDGMSRATGMAVQFEHCSVGMLGGVSLRGLTATNGNGDSFSAQWVFVRPSLWAALRGRLKFVEVCVDQVRFVRMERAAKVSVAAQASEGSAKTAEDAKTAGPNGILKVFGIANRVTVTNAALDWMKANGSVRTQLEGADLRYEETMPGEGRAELSALRGLWQELVAVDAVHARLMLQGEKLSLQEFTAQCGGGRIAGAGGVTFGEQVRFDVGLSVEGVDLGKMSQELPALRVSGLADGRLQMEGVAQQQQTWVGGGDLTVTDGMFKGLGVLQMLGQIFQVPELAQLRARRAHSKIRIADKQVSLEGLAIDAGEIQLTAPGRVDFKRALSLQAQISLPEQMIRGKALQLFDKRFSAVDGAGRRSLAFQVTGTLDKPQTDLLEKLVGDNLGAVVGGALGGVVDQFLGGFLKPRKPAKPDAKKDGAEGAASKPQPQTE